MVNLKLNSPENQKVDKCWLRIISNILVDFQGLGLYFPKYQKHAQ